MIRLLGAVLVTAGTAAMGYGACARLSARTRTLRALADALEQMARELSFRLPPMPELLSGLAARAAAPADRFLERCAQGLDELPARTLWEVWQDAAEECLPALREPDRAVLDSVGAVLGRFGGEDQRQALDQAAAELRSAVAYAAEEQKRQGRVYGTLSVTAGVFLVILLL